MKWFTLFMAAANLGVATASAVGVFAHILAHESAGGECAHVVIGLVMFMLLKRQHQKMCGEPKEEA